MVGETILNYELWDFSHIHYCLSPGTLINWYFLAVLKLDTLLSSTILEPFEYV